MLSDDEVSTLVGHRACDRPGSLGSQDLGWLWSICNLAERAFFLDCAVPKWSTLCPCFLNHQQPLEGAGAGLPEGLAAPRGFRHYALGVLRFLLVNWYKFVILGLIIALIVLTAVKVQWTAGFGGE